MENHPSALYANPLAIQRIGDPFVLRAKDGLYYCYPTSAKDGYRAWRSADLCNWEALDYVFRRKEGDWCERTFWAPEVLETQGKYFMYYTSRNGQGHLQIGVAVAAAPSGPFEDIGAPILSGDFSMIDASPFLDEDGAAYLFFVRDCSENVVNDIHESHIYGVRMNGDLVSLAGEPVLLTVPEQAWEAGEGTDWRWNEGPFVRKHAGRYYLQYSANCFSSPAYALGVAVAESPLGPYEKAAYNPVLAAVEGEGKLLVSGPGHHCVVESPDGSEQFAVYHTHTDPANPSGNRQVCIDRTGYHADGTWFVSGPTLAPQPLPSGAAGLYNASLRASVRVSDNPEGAHGLVDGDIGASAQSAAYDWVSDLGAGAWAELSWKEPILPELLAIYPSILPERRIAALELSLDGAPDRTLPVAEARLPGEAVLLSLPGKPVTSVRIRAVALAPGAARAALAEILVMARRP